METTFFERLGAAGTPASPEQDQVLKLLNAKPKLMALLLAMA